MILNLSVHILTTDPDSLVFLAVEDVFTWFTSGETRAAPTHQLDIQHVQSNHSKFIKSMN